MPDICMCEGLTCPLKERCYRYKATPDEFGQVYFLEIPFDVEKGKCDHYIDIEAIRVRQPKSKS